jgi:hypothetical protein
LTFPRPIASAQKSKALLKVRMRDISRLASPTGGRIDGANLPSRNSIELGFGVAVHSYGSDRKVISFGLEGGGRAKHFLIGRQHFLPVCISDAGDGADLKPLNSPIL